MSKHRNNPLKSYAKLKMNKIVQKRTKQLKNERKGSKKETEKKKIGKEKDEDNIYKNTIKNYGGDI